MKVITSLAFQGTAITPTYATLSVVNGQVRVNNLTEQQLDDLVHNDLTSIVDTITGGGSGGGVIASISALNQTSSTGPTVLYTTPNDATNHFYTISVNLIGISGGGSSQITCAYTSASGATFSGVNLVSASSGVDSNFQTSSLALAPNTTFSYSFVVGGTYTSSYFIAMQKLF